MKKYDKDATCSKCGGADIEDVHREADSDDYMNLVRCFNLKAEQHPERITRTCKNCGHWWNESPLDGEEEMSYAADSAAYARATAPDDKPVIEVGDVVRWYENSMEVTVGGLFEGEACLIYDNGTFIVKPISDLTLIRKGPKVHTFEGVGLSEIHGRYNNSWVVPMSNKNPMQNEGNLFTELRRDGKRYTLTLTEED